MPLKLISRPYRHTVGAMPIVCPVKNERNLLPHFLRHHRELGFERFIFIDNNSDDGTTDYLLGQSDCVVYHTTESFRLTRGGVNWISDLLNIHVRGDWGVYLDCDELLVYQDMETTSFSTYLRTYVTDGVDSFYALIIDLYPDGPWTGISARASSSLLADMNCFDKDYVIRGQPHRPWVTLHPDAIDRGLERPQGEAQRGRDLDGNTGVAGARDQVQRRQRDRPQSQMQREVDFQLRAAGDVNTGVRGPGG